MVCPRCEGKGTITCTSCAGSGNDFRHGPGGYFENCGICGGVKELKCPACDGKAVVQEVVAHELNDRKPSDRKAEYTTARLVLAIHMLLDKAGADFSNQSAEIRFIEFVIDRNNTDIKKKLIEICERDNPPDKRRKRSLPRSSKQRKEDLEFLKPYFAKLKLTEIVNSIEDEISSLTEDDKS